MGSEWNEITLGEFIRLQRGHDLPASERRPGTVPVVGSAGVNGYHDTALAKAPGLTIGRSGVGSMGVVTYVDADYWPHNTVLFATDFLGNDPRFAYYFLKHVDLRRYNSGSVQAQLNRNYIYPVPIRVPTPSGQRAIAAVLGALDDKIELNRRMNATLEAMARALFQSWFVDFDPTRAKLDGGAPAGLDPATAELFPSAFQDSSLGPIPLGWEVSTIGQIARVIDCLHAKKPERCETGRLYLQLNNIRDDGLIEIADSFLISEADYEKWTCRMEAVEGDCVITNVGRVGAVAQIPVGVRGALGRNMTGIRCREDFRFPTFLIECLLSSAMREEIRMKMDAGTILDALNVKNIPRLRFIQPPSEVAAQFEALARPLRRKMEQNITESRTLAALRDTLLPKLLSGELTLATLGGYLPTLENFD